MTPEEHELLLLMFARVYERFEVILDALKSREIWSGDDQKAFEDAVHSDDAKILRAARLAMCDYVRSILQTIPEGPEREALLRALQGDPPGLKE